MGHSSMQIVYYAFSDFVELFCTLTLSNSLCFVSLYILVSVCLYVYMFLLFDSLCHVGVLSVII